MISKLANIKRKVKMLASNRANVHQDVKVIHREVGLVPINCILLYLCENYSLTLPAMNPSDIHRAAMLLE